MTAQKYSIHFFFDYGTACFWAGNDRTREHFGIYIPPEKLPLSSETIAIVHSLAELFYTSLNQEYPLDPSPWRQAQCDYFNQVVDALFQTAKTELGDEFELVDEFCKLKEDPDLDIYLKDPNHFKR
jgi:hypothetical protein